MMMIKNTESVQKQERQIKNAANNIEVKYLETIIKEHKTKDKESKKKS